MHLSPIRDPHPAIRDYRAHRQTQSPSTATTYGFYLGLMEAWQRHVGVAVLDATREDQRAYRSFIVGTYRTRRGRPLAQRTQATAIVVARQFYRWARMRGLTVVDPMATVPPPPKPKTLAVAKDHLSLDEVVALLTTLRAAIDAARPRSHAWAIALRNLAAIALAFATGRRCAGLLALRSSDIDLLHAEVRVAIEKGRTGRILPVAAWATALIDAYLRLARPIILGDRTSDALFPTQHALAMTYGGFAEVLRQAVRATLDRNPDLTGLARKRITTHSLRVSFAKLMHDNGCRLRSLNELMLHADLTTTASYVPLSLDDQRRALRAHHPYG